MPVILAFVACGILALLALFQLALIAGAPFGDFAWGGHNEVLPARGRVNSAVAIVVYALFALIILNAVGRVDVLSTLVGTIATYVVAAFFFVNFVVSAVSPSPKERALMSPVNLLLAALCLFVAVTGHLAH
jgi:hypothetical protein